MKIQDQEKAVRKKHVLSATTAVLGYGVVVMTHTVGSQSGEFQFETYGEPIFNSRFIQFVLCNQ